MSDETNNNGNESDLIKDLRKQIRTKDQRLKELEPLAEQAVFGGVFEEFGLSVDKGPGKLARTSYDGEMDPDAVREWLTDEMGFEPVDNDSQEQETEQQEQPAGIEKRQAQQQRLQQVRDQSTASQGQKVGHAEWKQMFSQGPEQRAEAQRLHAEGLVDTPSVS